MAAAARSAVLPRRHARRAGVPSFGLCSNAARCAPSLGLGLYVGQTARDPDWRFDQHKAGYRASGAVMRFGVRLLPDLVDHLNPIARWESLEIEEALAEAFGVAGAPWVEEGH